MLHRWGDFAARLGALSAVLVLVAATTVSGPITFSNTFSVVAGTVDVAAGAITNTMLAGSIAASKLIGSDIATVGTVVTGTWNATTVAVAHGGTGDTGTAWGAYTPTLSCGSGTLTTSFASGVYKTLGKQVWVRAQAVLTTIGTCAQVAITPPVTADVSALNISQLIVCRETAVGGFLWMWVLSGGNGVLLRYDNTNGLSNGMTFQCNGTYEAS
jgi:hypothetical protein